jgi:dihydrodipicolinate synthase/N-acetylneuraminate lyase
MQPKFVEAGGAIIINPACGEIFYLSREEARRNVEIAMEECGGKVPVFAGVRGARNSEVIQMAKDVKEVGADGMFLFPPEGDSSVSSAWNADKYPEVWIDQAREVIRAADLPIIAHPTASPHPIFGKGLPLEGTLAICKALPNVVGWKMVYNYVGALIVAKGLRSLDRHVAILAAPADYFQENLATGYFDGTVSGSWNYGLEPMLEHLNAWKRNDADEARRIWKSGLEDLHSYVFGNWSRFHPKYKISCWLRGLIPSPFMRAPMGLPRKEELVTLRRLMTGAGIECIPEKESDKIAAKLKY